jgi:hypothetical protein
MGRHIQIEHDLPERTRDLISLYLMPDPSEVLPVVFTTDRWLKKIRERLSVSNRAIKMFDTERFNAKTLNDVEDKEQIQIKISDPFF